MSEQKKVKLIPKLSIKSVFGNVRAVMPEKNGDTSGPLVRIVGVAGAVKSGESNFGEWLAFLGQFRAINLKTNEEYSSGKLFLPGTASDMLLGAVQSSNGGVEFAYDIGIQRDDESSVGYTYVVNPLLQASENDPCERLFRAIGGQAQLPAPTKVDPKPASATGKKK